MIDINKEKEINLKEIFGEKKYNKFLENYPILKDNNALAWIRDCIDKYTNEGKDSKDFLITSYINALQQYCTFNQVENTTNLLNEEIDKRNLRVKKYLTFLLSANSEEDIKLIKEIGFRNKPSEVSVKNLIQSRIKSFYSNRGKNVSYGIKTAKSGKNQQEISLTKDIIKKITSKLESPEYRLICKFQSQLGLRISDILVEITSGNYAIEKFEKHYFIRNFRTNKLRIVINYLFFTEELTTLLQSIYGIDDLTTLDLKNILKTKNKTNIKKPDYLYRIKEIAQEIGINGNLKTHSFRKYFASQIRKCKEVDDELKEHLMGHTSFNLGQAYNNNLKDISWFYKEWKKLETLVCVDCIVYDNTNKDILKLKEENIKLKEQIEIALKGKIELEEKVNKLTNLVKTIIIKQEDKIEKKLKKLK